MATSPEAHDPCGSRSSIAGAGHGTTAGERHRNGGRDSIRPRWSIGTNTPSTKVAIVTLSSESGFLSGSPGWVPGRMAVMSRSQKPGRTVPVDERFRVRDRFIEAGKGGLENKISGP